MLLADDLSTVAITDEAADLLSQIDPNRRTASRLPVAVYTVAAALTAIENGTAAVHAQPSARVRTASGRWLRGHASRLHGSPGDAARITVIVEPLDARLTAPLLLVAHGLTTREAQVATLVLRGEQTSSIADALHISRHTVQDHLKSCSTRWASTAAGTWSAASSAPPIPRRPGEDIASRPFDRPTIAASFRTRR